MITIVSQVSAMPQASTYTVNSNADTADANPGDGICDIGAWLSYCTLHAAIQEANLDGGTSTIIFAEPMQINYPSLPAITENGTLIDASSQWDGTWPNGRPGVSIGGAGYPQGLLEIQASGTIVRGIEIYGSNSVGINITGDSGDNIIGGGGVGQRNVFIGGSGVKIQGSAFGTLITGNYFGTWDGENPISSEIGIEIHTSGNRVEENLIGGHTDAGIFIWFGDLNSIQNGNIIGANKTKTSPMPNAVGVKIADAESNLVWNNFIAGNNSHGVEIWRSNYTTVIDNVIGYQFFNLGNGGDGIYTFAAHNNKLGGDSNGNLLYSNSGYGVWLDGDNNLLQGNTISNNEQDGIHVKTGQLNQIGGVGPLLNEIVNNGGNGIHLVGTSTISNTLSGNYIGLSDGAFDGGNQKNGILIEGGASANRIGGLGAGEGNWIGWNDWSGLHIMGSATQGNIVEGNLIGTPINWDWQAPNGHHGIGIYDGAHNNWVGIGNRILSSSWSGIAIIGSNDNVVWFNAIGTDGADINWGNSYYGIVIGNSAGNSIFANDIAYNGTNGGEDGVQVDGGTAGNPININSIHDNGGTGIALVNGGNLGLSAPTITQASCKGPVTGSSCAGCAVEIFSDTADEGRYYEETVTADAVTGVFSWSGTPNGPYVTATASDGLGNSSAFSAPFDVGSCNSAPTAVFTVTPSDGSTSTLFYFDASGSNDLENPLPALEVRWDWDDDGTYDTTWNHTKTASHAFNSHGLYTIRLEVQDTGGLTDATTRQVSVSALAKTFLPSLRR